ncbi:hypothetical protein EZS27_009972 [termite gut metagenome]|uniref:Uncharacterized protein n=1 Tax=termite gut metagenome TaxID=433724 RepID=A0A5J4S979_9ZZZZ
MNLSEYRLKDTEEVLVLFRQDKEGFYTFYEEVAKLLNTLKMDESLYIPDICAEDSYMYFVKCVGFYIREEAKYLKETDAHIEFSIDYSRVTRCLAHPYNKDAIPLR